MKKQVVTAQLISNSENTLTICLSCQRPVVKLEVKFIKKGNCNFNIFVYTTIEAVEQNFAQHVYITSDQN